MSRRYKLIVEYLHRLENYHGEDVTWHIKNQSDVDTLKDELIELGDEEFVKQSEVNIDKNYE